MQQQSPIDLSIIIISWNVADLLTQCLKSITQSPGLWITGNDEMKPADSAIKTEVIVVDSASSDHTVSLIREQFSFVRLFPCDNNIGFVKGNNLGLEQARGQYLMLLNPDTEIIDDVLCDLVKMMKADESIGAAGPHTLNSDGSHQSTRRRFPTLLTGVFDSTFLEPYGKRIINHFKVRDLPDTGVYDVDWVQGSALMVRREVYEKIGGLDEQYIMYAEELDWCKRIKLAGWRVVYKGDVYITHHSGQSAAQVKVRTTVHFQHSRLRYFRKFHGVFAAFVLRCTLVINYSWQLLLESVKWLVGHKRPIRASRIHAYQIVLRSLLPGAGEKIVME